MRIGICNDRVQRTGGGTEETFVKSRKEKFSEQHSEFSATYNSLLTTDEKSTRKILKAQENDTKSNKKHNMASQLPTHTDITIIISSASTSSIIIIIAIIIASSSPVWSFRALMCYSCKNLKQKKKKQ